MVAIGLCYLSGRAVATHPTDRTSPEWPPHPDRVFMALAAALFETGAPPDECSALEWMERLDPPGLNAARAYERTVVTAFVPVNDRDSPIKKDGKAHPVSGTLPIGRGRQPRSFPTVIPEADTAFLIWPDVEIPAEYRAGLEALCGKVTYLGHSSSPVQVWLEPSPPDPTLVPVGGNAPYRLRVTGPGRLAALATASKAGQRPPPSLWSGYAPPATATPEDTPDQTVFDSNLIVFRRTGGQVLPLESTLAMTEALRGTVMRMASQPPPEWVSGHCPDGSRSEQDHLAFVPLADVGHEHADGHLLGAALVVPRRIEVAEVARCLSALLAPDEQYEPRLTRLTMGRIGEWEIAPEEREQPPVGLRADTWTRPARRWATVTPLVLDRYPNMKADGEARAFIAAACRRIGLPEPVDVVLMPMSLFIGAPRVNGFPAMLTKSGGRRWHTHALLTFGAPARGPVLLGAGRYRGYGLCRPYFGLQGDGA